MEVKIVNKSNNELPCYETSNSAGMDLRAYLPDGAIVLKPLQRTLVPTGLFMEIPSGYEGQVRPRSGLAIKNGISVLNTPGTIDADYRGEIKIILVNLSDTDFIINSGDRVAQIVFAKCEQMGITHILNAESLSNTERGTGGFGHTGIK